MVKVIVFRPTYSEEDKQTVKTELEKLFPYTCVQRSTLGGEERASLLFAVSFDSKEDWYNGILENSRYAKFYICEGRIEMFSCGKVPKFRAGKIKSIEHALKRIKTWKEKI